MPTNHPSDIAEVLIVGAGMCGLTAARALEKAGRRVLVVDKGRGFGGRMARRRIGEAIFEHGAQFLTAGGSRFADALSAWQDLEHVVPRAESEFGRGSSRTIWRAVPDMNGLASYLAAGIDVRRGLRVTAVFRDGDHWQVKLSGDERLAARVLVLTPPVPQTLALLAAGEESISPDQQARLATVSYERCWVTMAVLQHPAQGLPQGVAEPRDNSLARVCDHFRGGQSPVPAVTIQATDAYSRQVWDEQAAEVGHEMIRLAQPWLGSPVATFQTHRWRYCRPAVALGQKIAVLGERPLLIAAGDAFGGSDLESAAESGWAAAERILAGTEAGGRGSGAE